MERYTYLDCIGSTRRRYAPYKSFYKPGEFSEKFVVELVDNSEIPLEINNSTDKSSCLSSSVEIEVPDEIFGLIAEYNPTIWYSVSRKFNKIATDLLLKSTYVTEIWKSGDILYGAAVWNKPDIVDFFLRNEYPVISGFPWKKYVVSDEIFSRILQYDHYIPQITIREVSEFIQYVPDQIVERVDAANLTAVPQDEFLACGPTLTPYSIIGECRADIISRIFSDKELPEPHNTTVSVINYLLHGKESNSTRSASQHLILSTLISS
jgi:hypothetical protein